MWGPNVSVIVLRDATQRIRFQLGQSDRFKEGLIRSSSWETHIAETFANQGLPPELAVLPHVESSFNAAAYSKVGAAGLWQFMRSTGRRYMRIDDAVDERLDPYRSTEAAAQLLAYNYRVLGSWPLALTAYNHGAAGMRRAKETVGTDDFVKINRTYNSRTFGFASRNFFPSFLAALTIDENPEKYFGALQRRPEIKFRELPMPAYVRLTTLERTLGVDREQLRVLNPAWRPTIYQGSRLVPRGYHLRLPADTAESWTAEMLASRLPANELYAGQITPRTHKVRKGESLSGIAERYGLTAARLAEMNGISPNAQLRAGRRLELPEQLPRVLGAPASAVVAATSPATSPQNATAASAPAEDFYVVRRGDSLQAIAMRVRVPEAQLMKMNALKDPDRLYEGQRLRIAGEAPAVVVAAATAQEVETKAAVIDAARGEAQREGGRGRSGARGDHASHRQWRAQARSGAFGRGGGHGSGHHAGCGELGGRGRGGCARAGVGEPGGGSEPGARPGEYVARAWPIPSTTRCATTARFASKPPKRWASTPTGCSSRPRACATSTSSRRVSRCCWARNSSSTTRASRARPSNNCAATITPSCRVNSSCSTVSRAPRSTSCGAATRCGP